jgi:Amt family ammonium transporter
MGTVRDWENPRSSARQSNLLRRRNGALTGVVVITSGCATFQPYMSALGGVVGGLAVLPSSLFVAHVLKVDDPVDAITVSLF